VSHTTVTCALTLYLSDELNFRTDRGVSCDMKKLFSCSFVQQREWCDKR